MLDRAVIVWSVWLAVSAIFHDSPLSSLVFRVGLVLDAFGVYILFRCWFNSIDAVASICKVLPLLLMPLAVEMLQETVRLDNLFRFLGDSSGVMLREGKARARGPFGHPILAGTAAAAIAPLIVASWKDSKKMSSLGFFACLIIIYSSGSSGPILTFLAGSMALMLWRREELVRWFRRLAIPAYVFLALVMKDPVYYLIARVDLAGGSTSWYRARLIESSIEHISEWWLYGTDYTRHWMHGSVSWSANHTDITSHYIQLGVWGGLLLLVLFVRTLLLGFYGVHQVLTQDVNLPTDSKFLLWALGASLFSLAMTSFAVNYFDQTIVLLYFFLAAIGSIWSISLCTE